MNIIGKPFSDKITEQIEARQDSLGKGIGNSTKDLLYQQTKTPWLRLASSVNITKKGDIVKNLGEFGFRENDILGSQLAQNFVLQGGAISTSNNTKNFRTNSGLNLNNSPFSGAYGWGGTTDRGFVPMPGLTEASLKYINNGGWHFTNIKTAKEIEFKLKSYLHHREFDINPLTVSKINQIMDDKRAIYNLNVDKSNSKLGSGNKLEKFEINKLPTYIQENLSYFKEWID